MLVEDMLGLRDSILITGEEIHEMPGWFVCFFCMPIANCGAGVHVLPALC